MTNWSDGGGHYAPGSDTAAAPWHQEDAEPCGPCDGEGTVPELDPQDEADRRADDECDRRRDEAAEAPGGGW